MLRNQLVLSKSLLVKWKKDFFFQKEEREWVNWNVKNWTSCLREAPGVSFRSHNVTFCSDFWERYRAPSIREAGWEVGRAQMMSSRVPVSTPTNASGRENETSLIDHQVWTGVLWLYQELSWGLFSLKIDHFTDLRAILVQKPWYKTQWCILF